MTNIELISVSLPVIPQPEFYSELNLPLDLITSSGLDVSVSPRSPRVIGPSEEELKPTVSLPIIPRIIIRRNLPPSNGLLKFPMNKTIMPHIPPDALSINKDPTVLALAYTSKQNIAQVLLDIDEKKLISGRASDNSIYSLDEIKDFARRLGLKTSRSKDFLISEIKRIMADFKNRT